MATEKSLQAIIAEIKEDLKIFVQTRFELLRTEIKETIRTWKQPALLIAIAALCALSAWFAMVFTITAVLRSWIEGYDFGWFWGGLITMIFFLLCAAAMAGAAYAGIGWEAVKPKHTLRVLKDDQEWLRKESRAA